MVLGASSTGLLYLNSSGISRFTVKNKVKSKIGPLFSKCRSIFKKIKGNFIIVGILQGLTFKTLPSNLEDLYNKFITKVMLCTGPVLLIVKSEASLFNLLPKKLQIAIDLIIFFIYFIKLFFLVN